MKTEILRIGALRNTNAKFYTTLPLKWSDGPVRVLGIMIANTNEDTVKINYELAIMKTNAIIKVWSKRKLTLLGKIQVINSLILAQFVFRAQCIPSPPDKIVKQYRDLITNFIWDGKKARISFDKLVSDKTEGGVKLGDLKLRDLSLKVALLYRLMAKNDNDFTKIAMFEAIRIPKSLTTNLLLNPKHAYKFRSHKMAQDLLVSVCMLTYTVPMNKDELLNVCPWYNSYIKRAGEVIFHKALNDL